MSAAVLLQPCEHEPAITFHCKLLFPAAGSIKHTHSCTPKHYCDTAVTKSSAQLLCKLQIINFKWKSASGLASKLSFPRSSSILKQHKPCSNEHTLLWVLFCLHWQCPTEAWVSLQYLIWLCSHSSSAADRAFGSHSLNEECKFSPTSCDALTAARHVGIGEISAVLFLGVGGVRTI